MSLRPDSVLCYLHTSSFSLLACDSRLQFGSFTSFFLPILIFLLPCSFDISAEEMDRDKDGSVGFREFLFALTDWLGIESDEEMTVHKIVASNVK